VILDHEEFRKLVVQVRGVNEFVIPNYKQTWGDIRRLAGKPQSVAHLTFKSKEYRAD
jgi:hypothetical protein